MGDEASTGDAAPAAEVVPPAPEAAPVVKPAAKGKGGCCAKKEEGKEEKGGEDKGDGDAAHPKDVKQTAPQEFDGFLAGKKPNGKHHLAPAAVASLPSHPLTDPHTTREIS